MVRKYRAPVTGRTVCARHGHVGPARHFPSHPLTLIKKELFLMKRTDFSVDWLFAACAPDTELLPWNAQFTPVDLPHDWQIRHADDLYRMAHCSTANISLSPMYPAPAACFGSAGPTWIRPFSSTAPKSANGSTATRRSGSTSPTRCMRARTRFLSAAICATPTPAGTPVRACTAMWNCGRLPTST